MRFVPQGLVASGSGRGDDLRTGLDCMNASLEIDKLGFGAQGRATFAVPQNSVHGRLFAESGSPTRTPYQRDRDRIIHCTAFRRLKHKTQVFVYHEGDHFRSRLIVLIRISPLSNSHDTLGT